MLINIYRCISFSLATLLGSERARWCSNRWKPVIGIDVVVWKRSGRQRCVGWAKFPFIPFIMPVARRPNTL